MKLTLGFSTCPNDTYIFDAMIHHRVDTEGLDFDVLMADVEELNRHAFEGSIDITKLSYHAYAYLADQYILLNSGSALGYQNGPLLISKHKIFPDEVDGLRIAIPGKHTTANLLLSIAFPQNTNRCEYLFSDIEEAILSDEVDAGLIIHENRFTYEKKGLKKILDLGQFWEERTKLAIPLGGIVIKRDFPTDLLRKVDRIMRRSVEHAFSHPNDSYPFVRHHAQTMEDQVMRNHINLYVNQFTRNLGNDGRNAVLSLYEEAARCGVFDPIREDLFVSQD